MEREKTGGPVRAWWRLCPKRHAVLLISLAWVAVYFATREDRAWMEAVYRFAVRPWHRGAGWLTSRLPFSLAEWVIAAWVLLGIAFLAQLVLHFVRRGGGAALLRWAVTLLGLVSLLFGLFCLWWGVCYYAGTLAEREGLEDRPIAEAELERVTRYFVLRANELSGEVPRDADGVFTVDHADMFRRSRTVYHEAQQIFPSLEGPDLRAKPVVFSPLMSLINNTGFFFPFTAEANLNVACTDALVPATVAHELAHQRGVAREDEANFAAVIACMTCGDPEYAYSGALMAYVYLGNALHSTDYEAWKGVYDLLNEDVRRDLDAHNAYWDRFDNKVTEVSDKVYEAFLETYGDDRGMQSYDACVDLLVLYYLDRI